VSSETTHPAILNTRGDLLAWRASLRTGGKRLVQCHGCFDIVHPGHVRHLRWARAQGDALLVTITADRGIEKGPGRPLIPHDLRAENLASLDMVDAVHVVHDPTAEGILKVVQPDVYVKGREYEINNDPRFEAEREAVEAAGGRVVFSSGDIVFSSSALIAALEGGRDTGVDDTTGALAQLLQAEGMSANDLNAVLDRAQGCRVLVIGETLQEIYRVCEPPHLGSREPVMTLKPVGERRFDAGAAGVAMNLAAMGARPTLLTCPPPGGEGQALAARLVAAGVHLDALEPAPRAMTIEHYLAGTQKLTSIDHTQRLDADGGLGDTLIERTRGLARHVEAVCIADQGLGLLGRATARNLGDALADRNNIMTSGTQSRVASPLAVRGADLLVVSEPDLRRAVANPSGSLTSAAWSAMDASLADAAIVGLGPEGMLAFGRLLEPVDTGNGWPSRLSAHPVPSLAPLSVDATGADAAVLAAATIAMLGASKSTPSHAMAPATAALFSVVAEARALSHPGSTIVGVDDLRAGIARLHNAHLVYREPEASSTRAAS